MPKISLPVDSGQYLSDVKSLSQRYCVNLYPTHPADDGGRARGGLSSWPGTDVIDDTAMDPYGRPIKAGGNLYIATYQKLYSLDSADNLTLVKDIPELTGDIKMAWNGVVLVIVEKGGDGWFYTPGTDTLEEITDVVFTGYQAEADGIESVCFVDGRFVYCTKKTMFWGSLVTSGSGKTFDATATLSPFLTENLKCVRNIRGDLFAFGEEQSKPFSTTADQDLPFQEYGGGTYDKGVYSDDSVVAFDSSFYMVGNGRDEGLGVYRGVGGGGMQKISTDYIDGVLKDTTDETSFSKKIILSGFSYRGRPFIFLSMAFSGTSKLQFVYDIQSSAVKGYAVWFRVISSYEEDSVIDGGLFAAIFSILFGIIDIPFNYLVEYNDNIYSPSVNGIEKFNENKSQRGVSDFVPAPALFSTPYVHNRGDPITVNRVELTMDTGTSKDRDESITDTDVTVKMRYSDTSGETWVDCGEQKVGRYQQYGKRVYWNGLGLVNTDRIFEFSSTNDNSIHFTSVELDVQYGRRAY